MAESGDPVECIAIDYGQPSRDAEMVAAGRVAARLGVPLHVLKVLLEGWQLNPAPGRTDVGLSRAFLPGRNALFIVHAAAFAAMWRAVPLLWPLGQLARLPLVLSDAIEKLLLGGAQ